MPPEEFAKQVVDQIVVKSPGLGKGEYLWKGTNAGFIWLLDAIGWRKIFDGIVKKMVDLNDKKVQDAVLQRAQALAN
jgi:1-acylglycerone phosphate reductase